GLQIARDEEACHKHDMPAQQLWGERIARFWSLVDGGINQCGVNDRTKSRSFAKEPDFRIP
ncbi:MAG: hypothetical protein VXX11_00995, partial [Planctomycetota bacterium]|nr:hypothetical protein [Planctomycetota bacterium]